MNPDDIRISYVIPTGTITLALTPLAIKELTADTIASIANLFMALKEKMKETVS